MKHRVKLICSSEVVCPSCLHSQTTEVRFAMQEKWTIDARKTESISKIKDTIEKPPNYENVFKRNELGDPRKRPKRKCPVACKRYLPKNISNAKQDKLSNHKQEHATKKIQEFLQKSLYSNIQSQECKISRWDTMKGVSSLYSFRETHTLTYFFIQQLRLKHHQRWRSLLHGSIHGSTWLSQEGGELPHIAHFYNMINQYFCKFDT